MTSASPELPPPWTPTKRLEQENVPVAAWFVRPRQRDLIRGFYTYARFIDDVADSKSLSPAEKLAIFDDIEGTFRGTAGHPVAMQVSAVLGSLGAPTTLATDFLIAFRDDAANRRYATLAQLDGYCRSSAVPFGRFVLAAHGETGANTEADSLCVALQLLNHLQDCGKDFEELGRVYLPSDLLSAAGASERALGAASVSAQLRAVLDAILDHADILLSQATDLPRLIADKNLRAQSAAIVFLAKRLSRKLRRRDPLAARVKLNAWDYAAAFVLGLRERIRTHNKAGGSSFYWPMRLTSPAQSRALFAIYRISRILDDVVDGPDAPDEKLAVIDHWRAAFAKAENNPHTDENLATLLDAMKNFPHPADAWNDLLDGFVMDIFGKMQAPETTVLRRYCDCVAGSIGRLCLAVMGWRGADADHFANALGLAVQYTNILRDIEVDAALGRLYVPRDVLQNAGINTTDANRAISDARFVSAWLDLARQAQRHFAAAAALAAAHGQNNITAALAMMAIYRHLLTRLMRRGWRKGTTALRLSPISCLVLTARVACFGR